MTQEELIANLAPIRMPLSFAEFTPRDGLLALCLGLIAGLLIAKLLSLITTRRMSPTDLAKQEIARLQNLEPQPRLVGLSALLARFDDSINDDLGLADALYNPKSAPDLSQIESAILNAAGSRK